MTVVRVVDIVPAERSDETDLTWQPSIAINPANPNEIVVSAYKEPQNKMMPAIYKRPLHNSQALLND